MQGAQFNPWSGNYIPHATAKSHMPQLKILHATPKSQHSQLNKYIYIFLKIGKLQEQTLFQRRHTDAT